MRKDKHQHNFNDFSDQEKEKLKTVRQELAQAQKKEPERLWEHLQTFNDGDYYHNYCFRNSASNS